MNAKVEALSASVTFDEFCEQHGIAVVIHERSKRSGLPRWYASSTGLVEIRSGGTLTSTHGDGDTPDEALRQYADRLSGHTLLIGGTRHGREVVTPNEWAADVAATREP